MSGIKDFILSKQSIKKHDLSLWENLTLNEALPDWIGFIPGWNEFIPGFFLVKFTIWNEFIPN